MDRSELSRFVQYRIADILQEENLQEVNRSIVPAKVRDTFYTRYGKRFLDIIISAVALLVSLPINLLIGIVTVFDVGSPIFFTQERIGKDGKTFKIVKFRNMRNTTDASGELLPPNQRVTKWGKFVRKTSLDELLNFYSVLVGDMSIIGPRPLVTRYYPRYNDRHRARYAVRPGLECPPRDRASAVRTWNDQLENDIWYVENVSFLTDLKMIINLVVFALDRKNSAARANVQRGSFMGYSKDGSVLSLYDVPEELVERAIREYEQENTTGRS